MTSLLQAVQQVLQRPQGPGPSASGNRITWETVEQRRQGGGERQDGGQCGGDPDRPRAAIVFQIGLGRGDAPPPRLPGATTSARTKRPRSRKSSTAR